MLTADNCRENPGYNKVKSITIRKYKERNIMTKNLENTNNPVNENRITVMSKAGFAPEPKRSYAGDIWGIIVSILLIIGGASGQFVLRGTNSSAALIVAGFLFLAWDIISIIYKNNTYKKTEAEYYNRKVRVSKLERMVKADGRVLSVPVNVRIVCDKGLMILDYGPRLNGTSMTRDSKLGEYSGSTWYVRNILTFENLDLTAVFEAEYYPAEIVIRLFSDKNLIGIDLPGGLNLIPYETPHQNPQQIPENIQR